MATNTLQFHVGQTLAHNDAEWPDVTVVSVPDLDAEPTLIMGRRLEPSYGITWSDGPEVHNVSVVDLERQFHDTGV